VKSGGPLVGKVGECDVVSRHLQGCSPLLCRLRTDGLAPIATDLSLIIGITKIDRKVILCN
jgi:hypothetical protein